MPRPNDVRYMNPIRKFVYASFSPIAIILPSLLLFSLTGTSVWIGVTLWSSGHPMATVLSSLASFLIGIGFLRGCGAFLRDFNCHIILMQAEYLGEKLTLGQVHQLAETASVLGGWWIASPDRWKFARDDDRAVEGRWL